MSNQRRFRLEPLLKIRHLHLTLVRTHRTGAESHLLSMSAKQRRMQCRQPSTQPPSLRSNRQLRAWKHLTLHHKAGMALWLLRPTRHCSLNSSLHLYRPPAHLRSPSADRRSHLPLLLRCTSLHLIHNQHPPGTAVYCLQEATTQVFIPFARPLPQFNHLPPRNLFAAHILADPLVLLDPSPLSPATSPLPPQPFSCTFHAAAACARR